MSLLKRSKHGGALILLVMSVSLVTAAIFLTFYTILNRYSIMYRNIVNSEASYLSASKILRNIIDKHLAPSPAPEWPIFDETNRVFYTTTIDNTDYEILIERNPVTLEISFEVTSTFFDNPRKLKAIVSPPGVIAANVDIVLLIDTSNSMNERVDPNDPSNLQTKLEAAKNSAKAFIDQFVDATNVRIAIVSYSTDVNTIRNLTDISGQVVNAKNLIDSLVVNGSTNIGGALEMASSIYDEPYTASSPDRYTILLTDGMPTVIKEPPNIFVACINVADPQLQSDCLVDAADYANTQSSRLKNSNKSVIYTIGLGDSMQPNSIDASLLKNVASTPTDYFETPNSDELTLIYENIAREILIEGKIKYREVLP